LPGLKCHFARDDRPLDPAEWVLLAEPGARRPASGLGRAGGRRRVRPMTCSGGRARLRIRRRGSTRPRGCLRASRPPGGTRAVERADGAHDGPDRLRALRGAVQQRALHGDVVGQGCPPTPGSSRCTCQRDRRLACMWGFHEGHQPCRASVVSRSGPDGGCDTPQGRTWRGRVAPVEALVRPEARNRRSDEATA
jgi:hypothetical protein